MQAVKASPRQLSYLLFLVFAVQIVIRPAEENGANVAQIILLTALLQTIVSILLCLPMLQEQSAFSKLFCVLILVSLSITSGSALNLSEEFYRYASNEHLATIITISVVLFITSYVSSCGLYTMLRIAQICLVIFFVSIVLLFVASMPLFDVTNLQFANHIWFDTAKNFVLQFSFTPELILFFVFSCGTRQENGKEVSKLLFRIGVLLSALFLCTELTFGVTQQAQIMHALSRTGDISVFKRLDALHSAIWMLCALMRLVLLQFGLRHFLFTLMPNYKKQFYTIASVALMLAGFFLLQLIPQNFQPWCINVSAILALCFYRTKGDAHA